MKRFEYRVYHLEPDSGRTEEEQLLYVLNHYGHDGWRLNSLLANSLNSFSSGQGGQSLLFEREKSY